MSSTVESQFIARYVTSSLAEDRAPLQPREVNPATGTQESWHTEFHEKVAPAIKQGYRFITENFDHKIELVGYAKIVVDEFSSENFTSLATTVTTSDLTGLNWGRIIALFTIVSFVSADLVEKRRQDDMNTLEGWLAEFLDRDDLSRWITENGGWSSISRHPTPSWWQILKGLVGKVLGPSRKEESLNLREGDLDLREQEVAEREEQVRLREQEPSQLDRIECQLGKLNENVGKNTDCTLSMWKAQHDGQRQVDQKQNESTDRDLSMWRAQQKDHKVQEEKIDQVDAKIDSSSQRDHEEHRKTRGVLKRIENALQGQPPPLPSNDDSPDTPPPEFDYIYS